MKKIILLATAVFAAALLSIGCGETAANNSGATTNSNKAVNSAASNTAAPPAADSAAIQADIKKLVSDYAASTASNDAAAYDKVTTDNFMFVGNDGAVQTKAERVSAMKSGQTKYEKLTYDDVNVRVNPEGNGAVVIATATVKGLNSGKPIDSTVRVTQVWSKMKDGWKLASLQATDIAGKSGDKKADAPATADNKASAPAANK
jgi:ketosteroid isomerase-like protein